MRICLYGAASNNIDKKYITATEKLGARLAEEGIGYLFGGGAGGMMGAGARGVTSENGEIIGIVPSFFNVDGVLFDKCDEIIYTETMRERKRTMEEMADAFIFTPGGVGTLDEFFELLTLKNLSRHNKPIAIYNVDGFYDRMFDFLRELIDKGFIDSKLFDLVFISNDCEKIIEYIKNK